MSTGMQTQLRPPAPKRPFNPVGTGLLQRKCACGGTPGVEGECAECRARRLSLQRPTADLSTPATLPPIANEVSRSPDQPHTSTATPSMQPRFGHDLREIRIHPLRSQAGRTGQATKTFASEEEGGSVNPETGVTTITQSCCPLHEGEPVSSADKFSVIDAGPLPHLGGTQARYRFEYIGAVDSNLTCSCECCAFVQFVKGFFDINGVRQPHTLPGSGAALSPTTMQQDSPILPHGSCRVATAGGGVLNDTPGLLGIASTDNVHIHLEFDARTIDTCKSNSIVASRLFTLDITGAHPRRFSATGALG
jgi:hypothetical protein